MTKLFYLAAFFIAFLSNWAQAQSEESRLRMATDAAAPHLFIENPAIPNPENFEFNYFNLQGKRDTRLKFVNDTDNPEAKTTVTGTSHLLGFQNPIGGGAAFGIIGQMTGEDLETDREDVSSIVTEKIRKKHAALRLSTKLTESIRAAISLRYTRIDNDIAGNFFIQDDDRTKYSGNMTGFSTGVAYDSKGMILGVGYTPPMRGKAKISQEELIITDPGFINLDFCHGADKDFKIGAGLKKWLYKADDRQKTQTSPEEGNRISLYGLDHEQFLKPTLAYSVGADWTFSTDYLFRLSASQTEYVFLFEENQVPGDDDGDETKLKAFGVKAMGSYTHDNFAFTAGYSYELRKVSSIDPSQFWFNSEYSDYKSTDTTLILAVLYKN